MDILITLCLLAIFVLILMLPLRFRDVERNLEVFLFICRAAALTISGLETIPGEITGWNTEIVTTAIISPLGLHPFLAFPWGLCR